MKVLLFTMFLSFLSYGKLPIITTYENKSVDLSSAKAVLVVNIATRCGYTGQLDGLQKLYAANKNKNFVIVGVPSNEFGGQSPESDEGVAKFCRLKYGVEFPITKKASVLKGMKSKDPRNVFLDNALAQSSDGEIRWNFEKFLLDSKGKLIKRFRSGVTPSSAELKKEIAKLL